MVQCYIKNYHFCKHAKAPRDWYDDLLKPLLIPSRPLTNITLDFITGLSIYTGYNTMLIVVDYLTKKRYYIPCSTNENGTTTKATI